MNYLIVFIKNKKTVLPMDLFALDPWESVIPVHRTVDISRCSKHKRDWLLALL